MTYDVLKMDFRNDPILEPPQDPSHAGGSPTTSPTQREEPMYLCLEKGSWHPQFSPPRPKILISKYQFFCAFWMLLTTVGQ